MIPTPLQGETLIKKPEFENKELSKLSISKRKAYMKAYNKAYEKLHKEEMKAKGKAYRDLHKEERKAYSRRYRKRNPEMRRKFQRKYIARKSNIIETFSNEEWLQKLKDTFGVCPKCNKYVGIAHLTLDHIYPISKAEQGQIYTIDDVQPLCHGCNSSKGVSL